MKRFSLSVLRLFFCTLIGASYSLAQAPEVAWQKLGDDLDVAQVNYQSSPVFSSQVTFLRTSLTRYRVGIVRAAEFGKKNANVNVLCHLSKAIACINANFFDENGDPLGLVVSKGIIHQKMHKGGNTLTGVFQVGRNEMSIVNRSDFIPGVGLEVIQAGPRLLSHHQPIEGLKDDGKTRRSGLCIDEKKRLILYAVSSDIMGVSIPDMQKILLMKGLDCTDALNLDGGGSSQLYVSNDIPGVMEGATELFLRGRDDVPIAVALFVE